jgi:hypothetical protein
MSATTIFIGTFSASEAASFRSCFPLISRNDFDEWPLGNKIDTPLLSFPSLCLESLIYQELNIENTSHRIIEEIINSLVLTM